jgi:hypothetical protein
LREKKEAVEDGARGNIGLDLLVWWVERCEEDGPPPKKLMMMYVIDGTLVGKELVCARV